MTTKQFISILCLLVVSTLSYANLTIQDGNYLVVTHSNESLHIDLPGMDLIAIDPQNGTLGVIMRPAYVEVGTVSLVSANGLIGDSYRSHGGFAFSIQFFVPQGATCTVENIDEDNPLAAVVKNCTLSGTIKLKGLDFQ